MASKRELKKEINSLTYELITECLTFKAFHPDFDDKKLNKVMEKVVNQRNDLISRINQVKGETESKKIKGQYRKITGDIGKMVEALDDLSVK